MSAVSFCPSCGTRIEGDVRFCPSCGAAVASDAAAPPVSQPPQPSTPQPRKGFPGGQGTLIGVVLVVVALVAGILIISSSGKGGEQNAAEGPVVVETTQLASPVPTETAPETVVPTSPATAAPTTTASPSPTSAPGGLVLGSTCSNDYYGYRVSYPQGWYTDGNGRLKCQYFDPEAFVLAPDTEVVGLAVTVLPPYEKYGRTVAGFTDPAFADVISAEQTTIGGQPATKFESEATGNGFYEAGTLTYGYVVNLGGYGFSIVTSAMPGPDHDANKAAVDLMAGSLSFYA